MAVEAFHVTLTETLFGADGYCFWYSAWTAAQWLDSEVFLILTSDLSFHIKPLFQYITSPGWSLKLKITGEYSRTTVLYSGLMIPEYSPLSSSCFHTQSVNTSAAKPENRLQNNAIWKEMRVVFLWVFYLNNI